MGILLRRYTHLQQIRSVSLYIEGDMGVELDKLNLMYRHYKARYNRINLS